MDPYEILQIPKNATADEIKKAYRKLSLKCHPDKGGSADDFIKINMAFQFLNKPTPTREFYEIFIDLLKRMFAASAPSAPSATVINLKMTLKELYMGAIKKISVKVMRNNTLVIQNIYLSLLDHQPTYTYTGLGDNGGDILVKLDVLDHEYIRLDRYVCKYDLYIEKPASLYDLIYGFCDEIDLFGIETIKVTHEPPEKPIQKLVKVLKGKGLPRESLEDRGDVYIYYDLSLEGVDFKDSQVKKVIGKHFSF